MSLPELLALENAEVPAGVVLTQLVNPGTPVLYGSSSAPIDMRTMGVGGGVGTAEFYEKPPIDRCPDRLCD